MGAEQDSLEQKLPASVVKALQLFMERSFWNKWAEVTETHLQAPAQQFNSSTQVSCASSGRNSPAETWVETARGRNGPRVLRRTSPSVEGAGFLR